MHRVVIIFIVLEVPERGVVGSRIIRNAWDDHNFHGFGSGREGGAAGSYEMQGMSSFSWFWKCAEEG